MTENKNKTWKNVWPFINSLAFQNYYTFDQLGHCISQKIWAILTVVVHRDGQEEELPPWCGWRHLIFSNLHNPNNPNRDDLVWRAKNNMILKAEFMDQSIFVKHPKWDMTPLRQQKSDKWSFDLTSLPDGIA